MTINRQKQYDSISPNESLFKFQV